MKKIAALFLILVLVLAVMMTGCGGSETDATDSTQNEQTEETTDAVGSEDIDTEGMGDLLSGTYVDMMKNNEYLMTYKTMMDFDGQSAEVEATIAVMGDDMVMTSSGQGFESTIIMKDDTVYMVDHAGKTVTSWAQTGEDIGGMGTGTMETGAIDTEGITYIGSGKEDGLVYEEYSAVDSNVKYYFDGKDLVKIATTMGGETIVMEILEMSKDVPASMFEIPDGYQEIKM